MYPSPGSSENSARISALACSAFFMLRNQLCSTVSSIWRVIVKSINSLSGSSLQVSQAVPFPHGDLAIIQDLVGIVDDTVHNRLGNGAAVIRVGINALIPFFRIVLGRRWLRPGRCASQQSPAGCRILGVLGSE